MAVHLSEAHLKTGWLRCEPQGPHDSRDEVVSWFVLHDDPPFLLRFRNEKHTVLLNEFPVCDAQVNGFGPRQVVASPTAGSSSRVGAASDPSDFRWPFTLQLSASAVDGGSVISSASRQNVSSPRNSTARKVSHALISLASSVSPRSLRSRRGSTTDVLNDAGSEQGGASAPAPRRKGSGSLLNDEPMGHAGLVLRFYAATEQERDAWVASLERASAWIARAPQSGQGGSGAGEEANANQQHGARTSSRRLSRRHSILQVQQYVVLRELGRGAFAKVKLCSKSDHHGEGEESQSAGNHTLFALKVFTKSILRRKRTFKVVAGKRVVESELQRVGHEIAIMKLMSHRNLVRMYEVIDDESDMLCMVLEYVHGGQVMEWWPDAHVYTWSERARTIILGHARAERKQLLPVPRRAPAPALVPTQVPTHVTVLLLATTLLTPLATQIYSSYQRHLPVAVCVTSSAPSNTCTGTEFVIVISSQKIFWLMHMELTS